MLQVGATGINQPTITWPPIQQSPNKYTDIVVLMFLYYCVSATYFDPVGLSSDIFHDTSVVVGL
jgi:hypothetical protein